MFAVYHFRKTPAGNLKAELAGGNFGKTCRIEQAIPTPLRISEIKRLIHKVEVKSFTRQLLLFQLESFGGIEL